MRLLLTALMAVFLCSQSFAANLAPQGPFRALDGNGDPCAACKLYTYEAGTTSNKVTYTDNSEASNNTNPVILDSEGYADVWLGDGAYKFVLKDSNDSTLWTLDNITGSAAGAFGDTVVSLSANTSITTAYENNLILTTSSPTLSLLSAATAGEGFTLAVKNTDTGTTTIDPFGAETIDGSSTITLKEDQWAIIYSDGTNWVTTDSRITAGGITAGSNGEFIFTSAGSSRWGSITDYASGTVGEDSDLLFESSNGSLYYTSARAVADLHPFLNNYLSGLTMSNGSDSDHDILVSSGIAADSTNASYIQFSSGLTKQIDASWSAGNAAGGLFSGSVANSTTYHVFLIEKDSDGSVDVGFDTSVTAANIPSGYTKYRRIGSVVTDGSANIRKFKQYGDYFVWDTPTADVALTGSAINSASDNTITVPSGIKVNAQLIVHADVATNSFWHARVYSPDITDAASSLNSAPLATVAASNQVGDSFTNEVTVLTNTSAQVSVYGSGAGASDVLRVGVIGWYDTRD